MPLWSEFLIAGGLLLLVPFALLFGRYRLWRARFASGRTDRGFLETEIRWRVPFVIVGLVAAGGAFVAVMLSASR